MEIQFSTDKQNLFCPNATLSPRQNIQRYALRRILQHFAVGSFEEARFGCATYALAAKRKGLLQAEDSRVWETVMQDYAASRMPAEELQKMFIMLLLHGTSSVDDVFATYWFAMSRYVHETPAAKSSVIVDLDKLLVKEGHRISEFTARLPFVTEQLEILQTNEQIAQTYFTTYPAMSISELGPQQLQTFNKIVSLVHTSTQQCIYINGSAGTGKTFLLNAIIREVSHSKKNLVAAFPVGQVSYLTASHAIHC